MAAVLLLVGLVILGIFFAVLVVTELLTWLWPVLVILVIAFVWGIIEGFLG